MDTDEHVLGYGGVEITIFFEGKGCFCKRRMLFKSYNLGLDTLALDSEEKLCSHLPGIVAGVCVLTVFASSHLRRLLRIFVSVFASGRPSSPAQAVSRSAFLSLSLAISLSSSTKFFFPVRPNSSFVVPLRSPIPFCNFSIYFLCSLCFIHFLLTFSIFVFKISI